MPVISRATLSPEFFDHTSERLLIQPRPSTCSRACSSCPTRRRSSAAPGSRSGSRRARDPDMGAGVGSTRTCSSALGPDPRGGDLHLRRARARQTRPTIRINRPVFAGAGYRASRTVASGQNISTVPIDLSMEQVSITIAPGRPVRVGRDRAAGPTASTAWTPSTTSTRSRRTSGWLYRDRIKVPRHRDRDVFRRGLDGALPERPEQRHHGRRDRVCEQHRGRGPSTPRSSSARRRASPPRTSAVREQQVRHDHLAAAGAAAQGRRFQRLSVLDPSRNPSPERVHPHARRRRDLREQHRADGHRDGVGPHDPPRGRVRPGAVGYANAGPCIPPRRATTTMARRSR